MSKMFKIRNALLLLILAVSIAGCGKSDDTATEETTPAVEVGNQSETPPESAEAAEDEIELEAVKEPTTPSATRGEVVEALFEYAGEPMVDIAPFMEYEDFARYKFTDIEEGTPLAIWYGYALHASGADENADGTYTYNADAPATRMFLADILIEDMANRAFPFPNVCQSSEPVTDIDTGTDFYRRNLGYLMECGVVVPAKEATNVNPEAVSETELCPDAEVTKEEALASIEAYKGILEEHGYGGVIVAQYGANYDGKFATALNLTDEKPTQVAQQPAETTQTAEKPAETPANTEPSAPTTATGVETDAPGLAGYGLSPNAALNTPYAVTCICSNDTSKTTNGFVTFSNYSRKDLGNGYDKITLVISAVFEDENLKVHGVRSPLYSITDYYLYEEGSRNEDFLDGKHGQYSMTYNGTVYDKCSASSTGSYSIREDKAYTDSYTFTAQVPNGYNGIIVWASGNDGNVRASLTTLPNVVMFRCN